MKYQMKVQIIPNKHYIHVGGAALNVDSEHLEKIFLNENFDVKYLRCENGDLNCDFDMRGERPPFDKVSKPIYINHPVRDLHFEYDGLITALISGVNQINGDITELACYSGWFPKIFDLQTNFTFDITVELPADCFFACNGETTLISSAQNNTYHIKSLSDDHDIVLFAAKQMHHIHKNTQDFEVTAYFPANMIETVSTKVELLATGCDLLIKLYGNNKFVQTHKLYIYRPFGGWGYARKSIVILPQIPDTGINPNKYDMANAVFVDLHELAHIWWSSASTEAYDWINEAGAEFSALILLKTLFDNDVYNARVDHYLSMINTEQQAVSIVDTASGSADRELNHYTKTALLYVGAMNKFGFEAFLTFLRKYSQRYIGTGCAATDNFLLMCKDELGENAYDYFQKYLNAAGWNAVDVKKDILCK